MENFEISPLITETEIQKKVAELGATLSDKFKNQDDVVFICVLKGSLIFYSDLIREIELDVKCDFLGLSSYKNTGTSSGEVKLTLDLSTNVEGKEVVVVEDIVDTGLTMNYLFRMLEARRPKNITTVTLLRKPDAIKEECQIDHVGFDIPNDFVVGYGLDYGEQYRNLPFIGQVASLN